jgi:hypothetical protein
MEMPREVIFTLRNPRGLLALGVVVKVHWQEPL